MAVGDFKNLALEKIARERKKKFRIHIYNNIIFKINFLKDFMSQLLRRTQTSETSL